MKQNYICMRDYLRSTQKTVITCSSTSPQECKPGDVLYNPDCKIDCNKRRQYRLTICHLQEARNWRTCTPLRKRLKKQGREPCKVRYTGASKRCSGKVRGAKLRCGKNHGAAVKRCRTKHDEILKRSRAKLRKARAKCQYQKEMTLRRCREQNEDLPRIMKLKCEPPFRYCIKKCSRRTNLDWPCQKKCFRRRFRCETNKQRAVDRCFNQLHLRSNRCFMKANKVHSAELSKPTKKLYACLQNTSTGRVICMNKSADIFRNCRRRAQRRRMECWIREMDTEFRCAKRKRRFCNLEARRKYSVCLRACPRCTRVMTAEEEKEKQRQKAELSPSAPR